MSDGNFNRQLLPKTELASGLRAGRAQMRARAEAAFDSTLEKFLPHETQSKLDEMKSHFMSMLRS